MSYSDSYLHPPFFRCPTGKQANRKTGQPASPIYMMKPAKPILITIDGPAGAGKTTVSRMLAAALGYKYIDTGALYRAVALSALRAGVASDDDAGLTRICRGLDLVFSRTESGNRLLMNHEDVSGLIRTPEISMLASAVSARPVVREFLLAVQKRMGRAREAVFEGRDMGTVVFPDAEVKFFLDASPRVRAERRYRELSPTTSVIFEQVENDIIRRDGNDRSRAIAPLRPAQDAVIIDSSEISIDEVVEKMTQHVYRTAN
jgi:cytidylate kinase